MGKKPAFKYVDVPQGSKGFYMLQEMFFAFQRLRRTVKTKFDYNLVIVQAWRGEAEQQNFFLRGLSNAIFGKSPHNFGAAVDFGFVDNAGRAIPYDQVPAAQWAQVGHEAEQIGLKWGGEFLVSGKPDSDHVEILDWKKRGFPLLTEAPAVYTTRTL